MGSTFSFDAVDVLEPRALGTERASFARPVLKLEDCGGVHELVKPGMVPL